MRNKRYIRLWATVFLVCLCTGAGAQETRIHGIPADVYYLMPAFSQGMVYLRGQSPGQGKLNICALDNTLRFLDKDGKDLEAGNNDDVLKVRIDTAVFLRYQKAFYRLYPLSGDVGVAVRREVRILNDVKEGAYGTTSQTTSVKEYGMIYADGVAYNLDSGKERPYTASDLIFVYKGEDIYPLTRKGLRKLFPARKDDIDAWFKAGHPLPETVEDTLELLAFWAE